MRFLHPTRSHLILIAILGLGVFGGRSSFAATVVNLAVPEGRTYQFEEYLTFHLLVSDPVVVTGSPRLGLIVGSTAVAAEYEGGTGTSNLVFRYRVQSSDADADGISVTSPLMLDGGTIKGADGSKLQLAFSPPSTVEVKVDGSRNLTAVLESYLKASNSGSDDNMGAAVAISGDTAVIGAPQEDASGRMINGADDDTAENAGAAYVFVRSGSTWVQQAYLKAGNAEAGDQFGISVAISGDTLVVGASSEDGSATTVNGMDNNSANSAGAAYVFVRNGQTWTQQAYLKAGNSGTDDQFGGAVAIAANTVIVGATSEDGSATLINGVNDDAGSDAGAAYVFTRTGTTWTQQAYLKPSNSQASDNFGVAVAIAGDTAVVGAAFEDGSASVVEGADDNLANNAGAAYVFVRNGLTWTQEAYLKAQNTGTRDEFGAAVSISGDTVVVGAAAEDGSSGAINGTDDDQASDAGAVYVFERSGLTWTQQAYLKALNTGAGDAFGSSVTVHGNTVVIGASAEDGSSNVINGAEDNAADEAGAGYVFVREGTNWMQSAYLKANNGEASDRLGGAVAISGRVVIAGARFEDGSKGTVNGQDDDAATSAGAAYVFEVSLNDPAVIGMISDFVVGENAGVVVTNLTTVFGDVETASESLVFTVVGNTNAALVTATITQSTNLSLMFTPNASGSSQITIRATDIHGSFAETGFVVAVNDAPTVLMPIADFVVSEDTESVVTNLTMLFSDIGTPAADLSYAVTGNTNSFLIAATITQSTNLSLAFATNASGSAQITVRATDPGGLFAETSFVVTVNAVNDAPVAMGDSFSMSQGAVLTVGEPGVLGNDSDAESDPLTANLVAGPMTGTLKLLDTGAFEYGPDPDYFGRITFSYLARDAISNSEPATVGINVLARPTNSIPGDQTVFQNGVLRFSGSNSSNANALRVGDPDSGTLSLSLTVSNGSLTVTATNDLAFPNGTSSSNLLMLGEVDALNAALESLVYRAGSNYFEEDALELVTTDEGARTNRGGGMVKIYVEFPIQGGGSQIDLSSLNDTSGRLLTNVTVIAADTNVIAGIAFDSAGSVVNLQPIGRQDGSTNRSTLTLLAQFGDGSTQVITVPVTIFNPLLTSVGTNISSTYSGSFSSPVFNLQTSLYEQKVVVENNTPVDFAALRITATNLPTTVALQNASLTNGGQAYVEYNVILPAGSNVTLRLEYFSSDFKTFTPGLRLDLLNEQRAVAAPTNFVPVAVAYGSGFSPDGTPRNYVKFPTSAGKFYRIQYQEKLGPTWKTSMNPIPGAGRVISWQDDGPPDTDSAPGTMRFYRVITPQ